MKRGGIDEGPGRGRAGARPGSRARRQRPSLRTSTISRAPARCRTSRSSLCATITDDGQVAAARIYFRPAGDKFYSFVDMVFGGLSFCGTVPGHARGQGAGPSSTTCRRWTTSTSPSARARSTWNVKPECEFAPVEKDAGAGGRDQGARHEPEAGQEAPGGVRGHRRLLRAGHALTTPARPFAHRSFLPSVTSLAFALLLAAAAPAASAPPSGRRPSTSAATSPSTRTASSRCASTSPTAAAAAGQRDRPGRARRATTTRRACPPEWRAGATASARLVFPNRGPDARACIPSSCSSTTRPRPRPAPPPPPRASARTSC